MRAAWTVPLILAVAASLSLSSCSIKRMAAGAVAGALAEGGDAFTSDDDPELVRDALPFGLKTMESLLEIVPEHRGLLLAACQGYTQYAYAFLQAEADRLEPRDYEEASRLRGRALKLFVRARDFGLRGLERDRRGVGALLRTHPDSAARLLRKKQLAMLYWTAAAWGSAINVGKDRPDLVADLEAVRALIRRGLELDERYDQGAFHQAMIVIESLPPAMGGSPERARRHFERAVELSDGLSPAPYVTLAESVCVAEQKRAEFHQLLLQALAIDPDRRPEARLATIVLQRKARLLLEREDALFLDPDAPEEESP